VTKEGLLIVTLDPRTVLVEFFTHRPLPLQIVSQLKNCVIPVEYMEKFLGKKNG
jgi:hypothetical protein